MIEAPKWTPYTEESEGHRRIPMPPCAACTELALVDKETGLCRACWRVWRFSKDWV